MTSRRSWTEVLSNRYLRIAGVATVALVGGGLVASYVGGMVLSSAVRGILEAETHGEVTFDGLSLGLGTVSLYDVAVHDSEGGPLITAHRVRVGANPLTVMNPEEWAVRRLRVDDATVTIDDDEALKLPEATLAWLQGQSTGTPLVPRLTVGRLDIRGLTAVANEASVSVETVSTEGLVVTVEPDALGAVWSTVELGSLTVAGSGPVASVARAMVPEGTWSSTDSRFEIGEVTASQVQATVRWGEDRFGVPASLLGALAAPGWERVGVSSLALREVDLTVVGQGEPLSVPMEEVTVSDLSAEPGVPWQFAQATATGVSVHDGERQVAEVETVTLGADHVLRADGVRAWTAFRDDRTLVLPPVLEDHVPDWLGGRLQRTDAHWGVAFPGSPWVPERAVVTDMTVHLQDHVIAEPDTDWVLPMKVSLGPAHRWGTDLRIDGQACDGAWSLDGRLGAERSLTADVTVRDMDLAQLDMYLDPSMRKMGGVTLKEGRGSGGFDLVLTGPSFKMVGPGRATGVVMEGSPVAGAGNLGVGLAGGRDNTVMIKLDARGDLSNPRFSAVRAVFNGLAQGLAPQAVHQVGKKANQAVKDVGSAINSLFGRKRRRK